MDADEHIFCHRCGEHLSPGRGDFYIVRIEAFADPTPPAITAEQLSGDLAGEIARAIREASGMSDRELTEQVYRRLTMHLCGPCYRRWIENPAGGGGS
jgi:hypothetical protein